MNLNKKLVILFLCIAMVPIIGWVLAPIGWIILIVLWIIALINSLSGKLKETPLVGEYARKIDL